MTTTPTAADAASTSTAADAAGTEFESAPLLGNPLRIRGLERSMLERPAPESSLVGNPRRLRKLDATAFTAA